MAFDIGQIVNLVGQLGGDHGQALQRLQGLGGGQVDPQQHGGLLQELGVDPERLAGGGYQQHLDAQQDPGFQRYDQGGGFEHRQQYQQAGYADQGGGFEHGQQYQQRGGYQDQGGGFEHGQQYQQRGGYQDQVDPDQGGYERRGERTDDRGSRDDEGYRG